MKDWRNVLVDPSECIKKVVEIIDKSSLQVALVVSEEQKLLGTVTDGDIRRGILSGISLEKPVGSIMCTKPSTAKSEDNREDILSLMKRKEIRQIPIVDDHGFIIGLETLEGLVKIEPLPNHVVLMAGGLGKRLHPLTEDCPKPLLKVGSKPILETIINSFSDHGLKHFYLTVNYQANKIKKYFGDGTSLSVKIEYIEESKRMGTAGALSLVPQDFKYPFIVMNGDILTKVNFKHLLDFHTQHQAIATMCVREYDFQVPYGVVQIENTEVKKIEEKPIHKLFVNAGIYVLDPKVLQLVPKDSYFDMPDLFKKIRNLEYLTAAFPIREYWMDIGQIDDFHQANGDFEKIFHP